MIAELLRDRGGTWFFVDPGGSSKLMSTMELSGNISLVPNAFPPNIAREHYDEVSRQVLLWLFHYLFSTALEPTFGARFRSAWASYDYVNTAVAESVLSAGARAADDAVVFVQDYHLALVPERIGSPAHRACRLIYFHHVPWCAPDYFQLLPTAIRNRLLSSLLCCDVVGFHAEQWADAFLGCCRAFLPGVEIDGRTVLWRDGRTAVAVAPGPVDAAVVTQLANEPLAQQFAERLRARSAGRRIIVRVDRLDLWKNLVRGFVAFERLLEIAPRRAADLWFCAIVSSPRVVTPTHLAYQQACAAAAARINERFGSSRHEPVSMIFPDGGRNTRHRAVAALSQAAVTMVNPTFDGLNLVAKEATLLASGRPLLLSTNAGAYPQLRRFAIPVDPFDVETTSEQLDEALRHNDASGNGAYATCARELREETAAAWLGHLAGTERNEARP